ncbi:MAG: hypothetical protein ACTSRP_27125 [Candidatus Helarchaeota archaeon]
MEFWAGEVGNNFIKKSINHNKVMDSVVNYLKVDEPEIKYKFNKLFLDNGAYTLQKIRKIKITRKFLENIITIQEKISPDLTVPFDYPFNSNLSEQVMLKRWEKTKENIEYWSSSTNLNLVPALHAWNKKSLIQNLKWLYNKDFDYISVGSVLLLKNNFNGFFGDRQPNKNLIHSLIFINKIAKSYDQKIHIFGFGSSPLMYHLGAYIGIKSSDSCGYRRKAAYGKIILPQTGERYAGNGHAKFGVNPKHKNNFSKIFTSEEKIKLKECNCPTCREISKHPYRRWLHLRKNWVLRAIHNKWVMENEEKLAHKLLLEGIDIYEEFLDKIFQKSGLKYLWEYTKRCMNEYNLYKLQ